MARGKVDVMRERAAHHFGLLVDFLGHVVAEIATVDEEGLSGDRLAGALDGLAALSRIVGAVARQQPLDPRPRDR